MTIRTTWRRALFATFVVGVICVGAPAHAEGDFTAMQGGFVLGADIGMNLDPDQFAFAILLFP